MGWQEETTVIIPAYNEEQAIEKCIKTLFEMYPNIRLIVVDDGSTDQTYEVAEKLLPLYGEKLNIIRQRMNRGYGASLKKGMVKTQTPILVWFDADLQHRPEYLEEMVRPVFEDRAEAVLGAREKGSAFVVRRIPGKMVLRFISQIVARQKIPDLNCGYRVFRTKVILRYLHLLPDGFSASSTSTLLMIKRNYPIQFFPLKVNQRVGKSYVKIFRDGFFTLNLIFRIVLLFDAFLFFSLFAFAQILIGGAYSIYKAYTVGLGFPILGVLIIMSGLLTLFLGILSSQISQMRQERFEIHELNQEKKQ